MTAIPSCSSCRFSEPTIGEEDQPLTLCRLEPPKMVWSEGEAISIVTQVGESDWCSHYTPAVD